MGELIPCALTEVLPGDTLQQATNVFLRTSPLLAPVMHPVHVSCHHWFVPHRLVWEDWEDFITGGPDGMDASVFPTISLTAVGANTVGNLPDYLGIPPGIDVEVSALPFRAYALVWNEWYRDQDLDTPLDIDFTEGADTTTNTDLQRVSWQKDYFTSSRPWEQKGPAVSIPLTGNAPVRGIGVRNASSQARTDVKETGQFPNEESGDYFPGGTSFQILEDGTNAGWPDITADLSGVSAVTVNQLREALALQRYEEARARYGSRYVEYLRYLGVRSSDARLDRPEYLGGGKDVIQFSEVLQTAEGTDPVGELKGHGITGLRTRRYLRYST